jgi:hypothetical protein
MDGVVPFRMERVAADVESFHFGIGDLDALLPAIAFWCRWPKRGGALRESSYPLRGSPPLLSGKQKNQTDDQPCS